MRETSMMPARRAARLLLLQILLLLFLPGFNFVSAQTVIYPSSIQQQFYSPVSSVAGNYINNAAIDYANGGNRGLLMAAVWSDYSNAGTIAINDGISATQSLSLRVPSSCTGCTITSEPDVILGGTNNLTDTSYYAGVVYMVTDLSGNTDVYLEVFIINNPGSSLSLSYSCTDPVNLSNSGTVIFPPHIDIITKDTHHGTGPVSSDNFVVGWTQMDSGNRNVYSIYYSGLANIALNCSSFTPPTPVNITNAAVSGLNATYMDVAGVERTVAPNTVDDFGLFAFDIGSDDIYYQEWDLTTNTPVTSSAIAIDLSGKAKYPRIDAIDCYTQNDTLNGYANYDIVYAGPGTMNYNKTTGITNFITGDLPVVACGPGMQYTASFYANARDYSQLIDWTTGSITPNDTTCYAIDSIYMGTAPGYLIAVSSAVNNLVPDSIFVCWYNSSAGEIDFKKSGNPVAYKPASVKSVNNTEWQLSPNPAVNQIYLQCSGDKVQNSTFEITDITGRCMQEGAVTSKYQPISIGSLPDGMYLLHVYEPGTLAKTIKFVKE